MRLDHLLSRENVEGETRRHILRSIEHSNVFVRDRQERLPKEPLGSKCSAFSPLYRFQGSLKEIWGFSSAGRAPALQAGGQRFDPANLHQYMDC